MHTLIKLIIYSATAAVLENIGVYNLNIVRHGRLDNTVKVRWVYYLFRFFNSTIGQFNIHPNFRVETIEGSAQAIEDYKPLNEVLTFEPNEEKKEIGLEIVDDNQWEPDEEFFVKLTLLPGDDSEQVRLGKTSIMEITILNDDGNNNNALTTSEGNSFMYYFC